MTGDDGVADTAAAIAAQVREGRLRPDEPVRRALGRIGARDGSLGAFQVVRADAALDEARRLADRPDLASLPLAGVPVAVKDVVDVAGEVRRGGAVREAHPAATADHDVVRRLRAVGAVVVGTTRVPEACLWPTTDGAGTVTRSPWSAGHSAGGSSGGSGAAVAAGLVPLAHGTDGLGSVRIPAAACGVVGVKPGRGVVPTAMPAGDWFGLSEHGVLATTVTDAALMLSVLADQPGLAGVDEPEESLRVAVSVTPPVAGVPVDREVVRATFAVAAALMSAGDRVRRTGPRYPLTCGPATLARWFAAASDEADELGGRLQPRTRRQAALGRFTRHAVRASAVDRWTAQALDFFGQHDVLVTPTLAGSPLRARAWSERSWLANVTAAVACTGGFPAAWNLAGFPALSLPAGVHPRTGLPIGVQLVAAPGGEAQLLAAAATVERLRPWPRTAPAAGRR